jgi:YaiO family outer membrane protein
MKRTLPMLRSLLGLLLLAACTAVGQDVDVSSQDAVQKARSLAFAGKPTRPQALALLKDHLAVSTDDVDARVFYGIVLSWDGQYDEARRQLTEVLAGHPTYGDALSALINVELWSDHPARAAELAKDAAQRDPSSAGYLISEARALRDLNRNKEAVAVLDKALVIEPNNEDAKKLRRRFLDTPRLWEAQVEHVTDFFSAGKATQHETIGSLRGPTPMGSLTADFSRADRFGLVSYQSQLEFYPHIRSGTYGYLNIGYSSDRELYPRWRGAASIFHGIGHGFEVSGGVTHMEFSSAVNVYNVGLARYWGNWLFTVRDYLTPDAVAGTSHTEVYSARRMFGNEGIHDYIEFRYSHGSSLAQARTTLDIQTFNSSKGAIVIDKGIKHFNVAFSAAAASEEQVFGGKINRFTLDGSLYYRF